MESQDFRAFYTAIKNDFNSKLEQANALDIDSYDRLSLQEIKQKAELSHFFGMDEDGPYSEFLNKGLRSLRVGFYMLCGRPFYRDDIYPKTFAADVFYYYPDLKSDQLLKYRANIGPMVNVHKLYVPLPETFDTIENIPLLKRFEDEKNKLGTSDDHYMAPKRNFFDELQRQGKVFFVKESIYDPAFPDADPKPKRITWSFIDF